MAWIPYVAAAAASVFATQKSSEGGTDARQSNERSQERAMAFEERMSSSAYQRSTADMRAAGLNPLLAAGQGGASTPPGVALSSQDTVTPALSTGLQTARTFFELRRMNQEMENLQAVKQNTDAQTVKAKADTDVSDTQAAVNRVLKDKVVVDKSVSDVTAKQMQAELPKLENKAKVEKSILGRGAAWVDRVAESIRGLFGITPGTSAKSRSKR